MLSLEWKLKLKVEWKLIDVGWKSLETKDIETFFYTFSRELIEVNR